MTKTRTSGVIRGESNIAYAFDFPASSLSEETETYLGELSELFLSFLQKQSASPCDFVRFAGLRLEKEENTLALFTAFCPFEERAYRKVATLRLDDEGNILRIQREKRPRRKS